MAAARYPLFIGGEARTSETLAEVRSKFTGGSLTHVSQANPAEILAAVAAARGVRRGSKTPAGTLRHRARRLAEILRERRVELAHDICEESGRPLASCAAEIGRAVTHLEREIAEAESLEDHLAPANPEPEFVLLPRGLALDRLIRRVAVPICAGHRLLVLPHPRSPLTSLELADLLTELNLPRGSWSVLPLEAEARRRVAAAPEHRVREIPLEDRATREARLPTGGTSALVITDRDLAEASPWVLEEGFRRPDPSLAALGLVSREGVRALRPLATATSALHAGNPQDAECEVCCLEDLAVAKKAQVWLIAVRRSGARILAGGRLQGICMSPTLVVADAAAACPPPPDGIPALVAYVADDARRLLTTLPGLLGDRGRLCVWGGDRELVGLAGERVRDQRLLSYVGAERKHEHHAHEGPSARPSRKRQALPG